MTTTDIPVGCRCTAVRGTLRAASADIGNRVVCYCRDCQAYARFLGTEAILDTNGGSDIFQTSPAHLRLDTGLERIACVRLSEKGMLRWYAGCCRTPIANGIPWARLPFVGIVQPFVRHAEAGRSRDQSLGRPRIYGNTESATGELPDGVERKVPVRALVRGLRLLAAAAARGEHRPNPFFGGDGKPIVTPEVLAPSVHAALREGSR